MNKGLKEVIIMLLLSIFIILLLIIALLEYAPAGKVISELETYERTSQTANTIQEISTSSLANTTNESIIKSYSISKTDLAIYSNSGSYDKKGGDPFAEVEEEVVEINTNNTTTGGTTTNSTSGNKNNNSNNNTNTSTGYFNTTGQSK